MAMYTLKGIGEISTDAFDEKITLRNLLQHFSFYDFIIVDTKQNILFQYNSNDDWFHKYFPSLSPQHRCSINRRLH